MHLLIMIAIGLLCNSSNLSRLGEPEYVLTTDSSAPVVDNPSNGSSNQGVKSLSLEDTSLIEKLNFSKKWKRPSMASRCPLLHFKEHLEN